MYIFRTVRIACVALILLAAAAPVGASVALDFQVAYNPIDDVHVQLRATYGYYAPTQPDLRRTAAVVGSPEEMAVVFFISRHGDASVEAILERRYRGASWFSLMMTFGVDPGHLYLKLPADVGPPYGKAHGYRSKADAKSRQPVLSDAHVQDLVNLKVIVGYYHVDPAPVIDSRKAGRLYSAIHLELAMSNGGNMRRTEPGADDDFVVVPHSRKNEKDKGKGKGHGKAGGSR
jgi:hypothetical protein